MDDMNVKAAKLASLDYLVPDNTTNKVILFTKEYEDGARYYGTPFDPEHNISDARSLLNKVSEREMEREFIYNLDLVMSDGLTEDEINTIPMIMVYWHFVYATPAQITEAFIITFGGTGG